MPQTTSEELKTMPEILPWSNNKIDGSNSNNDGKSKMKFSSSLENLSPNAGTDLLRYAATKKDIVSLAQGEGCRATPDFICDAAIKALKQDKSTFYAPVLGKPELRGELSTYYKNIYGLDIPQNRIFVTGSGTTAVHLSLAAILNKGDEIVAVTPIWKNLLSSVELAEAKINQLALDYREEGGWQLDLEKLFNACTDKTKAIMIVSPSNPTGWTITAAEIKAIMDFARKRGIWIIADEIYSRTVYGKLRAPSFLDFSYEDDLLLVVNSFSKSWAMTGWRLGWLVGPPEAEKKICDLALYNSMGPTSFTQYGAIAALKYGEPFLEEQMSLWKSNRDLLVERFSRIKSISMPVPEATFYAFFKVAGEPDSLSFARRLIDDVGLSLAPGCSFGECSRGFIRLAFACSEQKLLAALERLEKVLV